MNATNQQPEQKVAVGLVRCSTTQQDHSIEDQEAEIRAWAKESGHDLLQIFRDEGVSGSELDRPGIRALLAYMEISQERGTLVAWHRSRLARPRDPRQGIALELKIEDLGWSLRFLHGSQASGNVLVDAMMGLVEHHKNGQYLRDLSADTLRSLLKRVTAGEVPGGVVPYGYAKVVTDSAGHERRVLRTTRHRKLREERVRWDPGEPDEVEVVQRIFARYASGEVGFGHIAKELNDDGVPSPRGGTWGTGSIRDLLTNPVYVGDLIWNRQSSAKFFRVTGGKITARAKPQPKQRPARKRITSSSANKPEDWIRLQNHHEGLVARSVFERVQEVMSARGKGRGGKRGQRPVHPLSGIAHCGNCGQPMYGRVKHAQGHTYRRYSCSSYERAKACAPNAMDADLFEAALLLKLKERYLARAEELLGDGDTTMRERIVGVLLRRLQPGGEDPEKREKLREESKRLGGKVGQAIQNLGVVGPELAPRVAEQIAGWERRRAAIDQELAKETGREEERRLQAANVEELADEALELLRGLAALDTGADRALTRAFFERAVKRIDLSFKTIPAKEGRKRGKHVFLGAEVQASDLLGVTQEVRNLSLNELLGRDSRRYDNLIVTPGCLAIAC